MGSFRQGDKLEELAIVRAGRSGSTLPANLEIMAEY